MDHARHFGQKERAETMAVHGTVRRGFRVVEEAREAAADIFLAEDEFHGPGDGFAIGTAVGLVARGHECHRPQTGDGDVAPVGIGAELALGALMFVEETQALFAGLVGPRGDHALGRGAIGDGITRIIEAFPVAGQCETGSRSAQQAEAAACQELSAGPHGSVPLSPSLLRDGGVILLDQFVIFVHERLRIGVGVHLRAQRLGQMAPDVLVQIRVPVWTRGGFAAGPALVACIIRHLILRLLTLLALLLAPHRPILGQLLALVVAVVACLLPALTLRATLLLGLHFGRTAGVGRAAAAVLLLLTEANERFEILQNIFLELACAFVEFLVAEPFLDGAHVLVDALQDFLLVLLRLLGFRLAAWVLFLGGFLGLLYFVLPSRRLGGIGLLGLAGFVLLFEPHGCITRVRGWIIGPGQAGGEDGNQERDEATVHFFSPSAAPGSPLGRVNSSSKSAISCCSLRMPCNSTFSLSVS